MEIQHRNYEHFEHYTRIINYHVMSIPFLPDINVWISALLKVRNIYL